MTTRTAYAQLYPSPTVTPIPTSVATQNPVQKTIDPLEMTATYIVGEATDAAAIELTSTAVAVFGFAITEGNPALTITPIPTYSSAELSQQKKTYLNKLITTAGFSSPIFEEIANNLLVEEGVTNQYIALNELEPEAQSISFNGSKYVVLVVTSEKYGVFLSHILLFRVTNQESILLDDPSTKDLDGFVYVGFNNNGFADVNGNGLPDLTVYTSYGGNCCLPQLHILEIQSDHQMKGISPKTTDVYPARLIDLNNDGVPEIQGQSPGSGMSTIWLIRWFGWNGKAYVDISRQHPELYLTTINELAQEIGSSCSYNLDWSILENYLVNFYAMGRLSDGWDELQRLLKLHCSADELQKAEGVLKDVEQWMNSLPKS
jgi:hypothetical protein